MKIYKDVTQLIGRTLLELSNYEKAHHLPASDRGQLVASTRREALVTASPRPGSMPRPAACCTQGQRHYRAHQRQHGHWAGCMWRRRGDTG